MPTEEKTLEYAKEKGWDRILKISIKNHNISEIERSIGRKISDVEIRAMCALNITQIVTKEGGGYALIPTGLGLKLLQEESDLPRPA